MDYNIPIKNICPQELFLLQTTEEQLRDYIAKLQASQFKQFKTTVKWSVNAPAEPQLSLQSNAAFAMTDSLLFVSKIENFAKSKLNAEFHDCSVVLDVNVKPVESDPAAPGASSSAAASAKPDGLPTFLPQEPRYRFDQIILPDDTRKRIMNDLNVIENQDLIYHQWGFDTVDPKPKSVLNFFGPPGTGKTMCAHAIAHHLQRPLLALNYSEIESKYVGDAAKNLKKAFDTAAELNAVMFFDEADSFLGKRIENVSQGADQALNSLRSQMLILLEEFEGVVLFATNLITNFDKAFESRILDHIKLDLPNREARAEIIGKMIPAKLPVEHPFTQDELLEASDLIEGLAGREIKSAVLSMLLRKASEEGAEAVFTLDDLKEAMRQKKESIEQLKAEEAARRKEKILKRLTEKVEEQAAEAEAEEKRKQQTSEAAPQTEAADEASKPE